MTPEQEAAREDDRKKRVAAAEIAATTRSRIETLRTEAWDLYIIAEALEAYANRSAPIL